MKIIVFSLFSVNGLKGLSGDSPDTNLLGTFRVAIESLLSLLRASGAQEGFLSLAFK